MNRETQQKGVSDPEPDMEPKIITIAVLVPEGKENRDQLDTALKMLAPYQIAMSLEDEMGSSTFHVGSLRSSLPRMR